MTYNTLQTPPTPTARNTKPVCQKIKHFISIYLRKSVFLIRAKYLTAVAAGLEAYPTKRAQ